MNLFLLTLLSLCVALMSFAGIVFSIPSVQSWYQRHSSLIIFFSAGVLIATTYNLISESFEHNSFEAGLLWLIVGGLGTFLATSFIPLLHHHRAEHTEHHEHHSGFSILIGDAIHNLGDGILLGSTFGIAGISSALSLLPQLMIHEVVQEVSDYTILVEHGFKRGKALMLNVLSGLTVLIGSWGSFFFLTQLSAFEGLILALASGSFLIMLWQDVIPLLKKTKISFISGTIALLIGVGLVAGLSEIGDHGHNESTAPTQTPNSDELHQ